MPESTLPPRRRYLPELKLKIVREALDGPLSKAAVARKYNINANMVSNWIREYRDEARWVKKAKAPILPIVVDDAATADPTALTPATQVHVPEPIRPIEATLTIQFTSGHQITVSNPSETLVRQILSTLA
ncbi:IS66-like element accessory protein TnpA [Marinobacterium aestuariivivens]|uniref:Transposase n=1 Tax=Marinobacterium aestuariivivens TaxID=1698799 RepID=A0ABW2A393_9GAMM